MSEIVSTYQNAVHAIKTAILESQQIAVQQVANVQLALYYGIGRYLSANTRQGSWGTGAIDNISEQLQKEMPGLRGISARSLRYMRTFYEEWSDISEITISETESESADVIIWKSQFPKLNMSDMQAFTSISFTHHIEILKYVKSYEERVFYIRQCAATKWSVNRLKQEIRSDAFHHQSHLPNNFIKTMPSYKQALKAIVMFKDEYLLDYINTEELGARDSDDVDERVIEQSIVHNIKNFIMTFGQDFSFIGNQYRVVVGDKELFIDLHSTIVNYSRL